jgi:predicted transcriptional regulator
MKNKTFIFKYDPESSMERIFADLQQAWEGKLKAVEPNIIRSNSIKALLHGLTEERLELFSVLAQKKPNSLTELAKYLGRDYQVVKKDSEILAAWGVIGLQEEKPVAIYEKITLEFPSYTEVSVANKKREEIRL